MKNPVYRFSSFLETLYNNRYMIKTFAYSDIKRRYVGSFGGIFWSVIHPLVMVVTYYVIFSYFFKARIPADYGTKSYGLWLISGLLPWFYFNDVVIRSAGSLYEYKALVTKTLFPSEIIPVCLIISAAINHFIGLLVFFILSIAIAGWVSSWSFLFVIYFFLMTVMALGFSWAFSSLNAFVRDVGQGITILFNLWFFYTPIFYPIGIIPDKYHWIIKINPFYHIVEGYRASLLGAAPDIGGAVYVAAVALSAFVAGGLLYKRLKPAFADVL